METSVLPSYQDIAAIQDMRDFKYVVPVFFDFAHMLFNGIGQDIEELQLEAIEISSYTNTSTTYVCYLLGNLPATEDTHDKYIEYILEAKISDFHEIEDYDFEVEITEGPPLED